MEYLNAHYLGPQLLFIMFIVAIVAGFVDAIAGGGGLIAMPAFLLAGVPPITALGTNRLQASIGELTSIVVYKRRGLLIQEGLLKGAAWTGFGAVIGSISASIMTKEALEIMLPALMVCILLYTVFSKRIRENTPQKKILSPATFMCVMGIILGFYNGFFGPGTGSLWVVAFVSLMGATIKQASIYTKPLNFTSNIVSLAYFIFIGKVIFLLGGIMALGQIIGAAAGSKLVVKNGEKVVRPFFILVVSAMTIKLIWQTWLA
ncbi:TSUP family transporter [Klebsiella pneumoniae]|uniref:TSUP family transporter n=3 Tax=Klebsiella pneumoniae TaxID=573 RepID=UPI0024A97585|nr:TSUP family transporter [Klebsiella pneumoniae]HDO7145075.1 TSUP family transporter [Klebsiella pneumoniae]HDO7177663.1 TSUP family transporter [Klebsiella pneumoniae]HDO7188110.1 TSUP family transporter [Klebsiella pneumoniae]